MVMMVLLSMPQPQVATGWIYCSAVVILVFAVLNILKELVQFYHHKFKVRT